MPVHLHLREGVAKLPDRCARRIVDEHLFGPGLGGDVVDDRDAFVEEMAPPRLDIASHPVTGDPLPFETCDELARHRVQIRQHVRERLRRGLLHRKELDPVTADEKVIAVAFDRRVRDEVVEIAVRRRGHSIRDRRVVVQKLPEEAERLLL